MDATLVFALQVTDDNGETDLDVVTITVVPLDNVPPSADAGDDQTVEGGGTVTLSAAASSDPDEDDLSFSWAQIDGEPVSLDNTTAETLTFELANIDDTLVFEVTVDDGQGHSATDTVTVTSSRLAPILLLVNRLGNSVVGFVDPGTLDGNVAPDTEIVGDLTTLAGPTDVLVNLTNDLVVSQSGTDALQLFGDPEVTTGNIAPPTTVLGPSTLISDPAAMAYDATEDLIFVANKGDNTDILVFTNPTVCCFNDDLAPIRVISIPVLSLLTGMHMTPDNDLYVVDNNNAAVLVFAEASTLRGDVEPDRTLTSDAFEDPFNVFVDDDDRLYVVNNGGSVQVFEGASDLSGDLVPDVDVDIEGSRFLTAIVGDVEGRIYVVDFDENAIYVFDGFPAEGGTISPDRTIRGDLTRLDGPIRAFVWQRSNR